MASCTWSLLIFLVLISTSLSAEAPTSTYSYLTTADKIHLKKILEPGFELHDLPNLYYAVFGYKYLQEPITKVAEICEFLINSITTSNLTPEQLYYFTSTWNSLKKCQPKSVPLNTIVKALTTVIEKESSTISELYHAVHSLVLFGQKISDTIVIKLVKNLQTVLKKDDSLLNLGYAFHIAADLGSTAAFAFNHIEDVIVQADEVDNRFLQFEGGLSVTSLLVNGVYKLASSLKKKPPLTSQQIVKLANYFLSRRSVQTPKGAMNFLSSINIVANNEFDKPICISLLEDGAVISTKQPFIRVKVCDILGNPISSIKNVIANTATKIGGDVAIISKKEFYPTSLDKTSFMLNFMATAPEPGFYKIIILAGTVSNTLIIKVLTEVKIDYLEIGTADADQTTQPKLLKVVHPQKLHQIIEADSQQKVVLRFSLKDVFKNKPMRVHQAFICLSSTKENNKQEIIFVAEPDTSYIYKFDLPVGTVAKNFNYENMDYNVELIVGDSVLSNSFQWTLATINLKFPEPVSSEVITTLDSKRKYKAYKSKPEIKHMFREPEKRPPAFVSNLFTGLCLSPILLLLILWIKLGINISNFPCSINAIIFHLGLGSIFILFGIFWLKLNMFTTLRYLIGLGIVTFLSGNKLLSQIAHNRKISR